MNTRTGKHNDSCVNAKHYFWHPLEAFRASGNGQWLIFPRLSKQVLYVLHPLTSIGGQAVLVHVEASSMEELVGVPKRSQLGWYFYNQLLSCNWSVISYDVTARWVLIMKNLFIFIFHLLVKYSISISIQFLECICVILKSLSTSAPRPSAALFLPPWPHWDSHTARLYWTLTSGCTCWISCEQVVPLSGF